VIVKKRSRACKHANEKLSDSATCKEALIKEFLGIKPKNDKKEETQGKGHDIEHK
jgi:hypothetical protein